MRDVVPGAGAPPTEIGPRSEPGDEPFPAERGPWSRRLVLASLIVTGGVAVLLVLVVTLSHSLSPSARAILSMAVILIVVWIGIGGFVQHRIRERARTFLLRARGGWRLKFVLLATLLALIEEAITTGLTNLAGPLGSNPVSAHITASTNYLVVIGFSSVVVLVPEFIAWSYLLSRIDFRPFEVFLLYGLTGSLGEGTIQSFNALLGFWFPLYGLFVFLPTYTLPSERVLRPPRWYHYAIAVLLPFLFASPVAIVDIAIRQYWGIPLLS